MLGVKLHLVEVFALSVILLCSIFINGRPVIFLFGCTSKEIHVITLPSTTKYVILGSFRVFGLTATKLWLIQI